MNEYQVISQTSTSKKHRTLKKFLTALLILVAVFGIGYSIYSGKQNVDQQAALNNKDTQIKTLNAQIATFKSNASSSTSVPASSGTTIAIRELGISITVPDSLKDLTYSYIPISNENGKFEAVDFSTKSLADQYAGVNREADSCSSFGSAPPLGAFERWKGTYDASNPHQKLAKQLDGYYITYDSPQATCIPNATSGPNQLSAPLAAFQSSFGSIKQL